MASSLGVSGTSRIGPDGPASGLSQPVAGSGTGAPGTALACCRRDRAVHHPPAVPAPRHRSGPSRAAGAARGRRSPASTPPASSEALVAVRAPAGDRRPRSPGSTPSRSSTRLAEFTAGRRRQHRRRHRRRCRPPTRPRCWPPAPGSRRSAGSTPARATPRSARCARPATTPRPTRAMGFCLFNNVAVTAGRAGRPGRAGADRRLRRPPRQRHPGRLLRRRPRGLRVVPPVPALPRHRAACARSATGDGVGHHHQPPAARRAPPATSTAPRSTRCWPRCRRALAADLAAGVGRLRRPPRAIRSPASACRRATSPTSPRELRALVAAGPPHRVPRGRLRPRRPGRRRPAPRCRALVRRATTGPRRATSGGPGAARRRRPCSSASRGRPDR